MSKQRPEQSQDSIFVDNPFVDGFLEWMGSREGRQCIEARDVLWDLLEDLELDAKQRQLTWPDGLDLVESIQRIQKLYPDFPGHEIEEVLLNWIDFGYDPENYSQAQLNEIDSLTERWVADHLRNAKASKTRKRTRHSFYQWADDSTSQINPIFFDGSNNAITYDAGWASQQKVRLLSINDYGYGAPFPFKIGSLSVMHGSPGNGFSVPNSFGVARKHFGEISDTQSAIIIDYKAFTFNPKLY
jgi:hypothetical protein